MSTIGTTISHGVTLTSSGAYQSPLTVTATGYITNAGVGAAITAPFGTVINAGQVVATGGSAFGDPAIYLESSGSIDNNGTISGSSYGLKTFGGTITNSGSMLGGRWAISSKQAVSIGNTGLISGFSNGIIVNADATITNSATIIGSDGIGISYGTGTIDNSGSITATYGTGIALLLGGSVGNAAGGVIAATGYPAIYSTGGGASVYNAGTISGYSGVLLDTAGTLAQTLVDRGTIIGSGGTAIAFGAGDDGLQLLPADLLIQGSVAGGGGSDVLEFASSAATGTLSGDADFIGFAAGTVDAGAQWRINGGATIGAGTTLAVAGSLTLAGSVVNAGSIADSSDYGFRLAPGAYLLNTAAAAIDRVAGSATGFAPAIFGLPGGASTVTNLGTIDNTLFNTGIYLAAGGTVTNGSPTATHAVIDALLPVYIYNGAGLVANFGTILSNPSSNGVGIDLVRGGTIVNGANGATSAVISAGQYAITTSSGGAAIANYGTVAATLYGIDLRAGGTVTNAGTVAAPGHTAIAFGGAGGDLLTLEGGFAITGAITASGGGNVLQLQGSAATPVVANYTSLHPTGFATMRFAGGSNFATLAISGTIALPGTIAGFTGAHDTIDLTTLGDAGDDVVANLDTITNTLTVSGSQGSVLLQLDSESYAGIAFVAASDGAGGTFLHPTASVAPGIAGTVALQAVADQAASRPFAGVTVSDASVGPTETLTVALSPVGGGVLSSLDSGSFNSGTGVYTVIGTPAAVSSAVDGLVFTPAAPSAGLLATTGFTLTDSGPGGSTTDSASSVTTVTQVAPFAGLGAGQYRFGVSASGGSVTFSGAGSTSESVVLDPTSGGTYAVPSGDVVAYLGGNADATLFDPNPVGAMLIGNAGNDQILAGTGADTVRTAGGATRVALGAGNDVVISAGADQIAGGSGNATITSGSNSPVMFLGSGANSVVAGAGGHASVVGGDGADTIIANGGSQLWLGSVTDVVTTTGADTVIGGTGAATVSAGSGNALVFGGAGALQVAAGSGAPTVVGGSGGVTVAGGAGSLMAFAFGAASVAAGGGATTVVGFGGAGVSVTGGSGAGVFVGAPGGENVITAGAGPALILGGGDGDVITGGSDDTIAAGPGAETINSAASNGSDFFYGSGGDAVFQLGSGTSQVLAGSGGETVAAGGGVDVFAFAEGGDGTAVIQGFNVLHDVIGLIGFTGGEASSALAGAVVSGGSETFSLSDGTHITLQGFTGLTAASFV